MVYISSDQAAHLHIWQLDKLVSLPQHGQLGSWPSSFNQPITEKQNISVWLFFLVCNAVDERLRQVCQLTKEAL